jgi:hypothetical protein
VRETGLTPAQLQAMPAVTVQRWLIYLDFEAQAAERRAKHP